MTTKTVHPYRRTYPQGISIEPKPKPQAGSWWAGSYQDRAGWYAAAHVAEARLKGAKKTYASDCDTGRFGDYWKKAKPDERRYVEDDFEQERVA
jgi:hypothetical protein